MEPTALLSALARSSYDSRRSERPYANRLAGWLMSHKRRLRLAFAGRSPFTSSSIAVWLLWLLRLPSVALFVRATFHAASHQRTNQTERSGARAKWLAIGEPGRVESSRLESNRAGTEREERAHRIVSYLSWRLACASPHVTSACTECHTISHSTLNTVFFLSLPGAYEFFDTPRSVPDLRLSRRSAIMPELFIRERR